MRNVKKRRDSAHFGGTNEKEHPVNTRGTAECTLLLLFTLLL